MQTNDELYNQDFYAWINSQITLLRNGQVQHLDQELLAEELKDMANHHRNELVNRRNIRSTPSLKPFFNEAIKESYSDAFHIAIKETKLDKSVFPEQCPYQEQELLDEDFWPD